MSIIWNSRIYMIIPDAERDTANAIAFAETGNQGEYNTFSIPLYTVDNPTPTHWGCSTICYAARRQRLQQELAYIPGIKFLTIEEDSYTLLGTNLSVGGYTPGNEWTFMLGQLGLYPTPTDSTQVVP